MSNESKALVLNPRSIDECMSLAERLSKATTIALELRNKPADVLAAIMAGHELGFSPMAALRSFHMINGVPKLTADAMVAAVLASGKAEYFEPAEVSDTSVTYVTKRVGSTREQSCTWTKEDAKRAGLTSDNHRLYPRQMLASRAKSELARSIYPDILAGVYTDDEVPAARNVASGSADRHLAGEAARVERIRVESNADAVDAEVVSETIDAPELDAIDTAPSVAELQALIPKLEKLKGPQRTEAKKRYGARLAALESTPVTETNGAVA